MPTFLGVLRDPEVELGPGAESTTEASELGRVVDGEEHIFFGPEDFKSTLNDEPGIIISET